MNIRTTSSLPEQINIERKPAAQPQKEAQQAPVQDNVTIGGNQQVDQGVHKKWTFLHYGAADNNLAKLIMLDVDEMEKVGSDANTHIVSQLDQSVGSCKRYYVTQDNQQGKLNSPVLEDMGPKVDMSNPKTLTDFITWGVKNFPGDNLAVVIGSHGGGTMGAAADDRDGHIMSPAGLKQAFADAEKITGKKVDVLGFDCCLMANTEVAYELKDSAKFIVASEESEGGYGWPYHNVMNENVLYSLQQALASKLTITPEQFAKKIVTDASHAQSDLPTMSTIDTSKMPGVAKAFDDFAKSIIDTDTSKATLKDIARKSQSFSSFKDSYHFCEQIVKSNSITDEKLKAEAQKVMDSLNEAIIANQSSKQYPNAHGLQMEIPTGGYMSSGYQKLDFAKDTKWDEAMASMGSNKSSDPYGWGTGHSSDAGVGTTVSHNGMNVPISGMTTQA